METVALIILVVLLLAHNAPASDGADVDVTALPPPEWYTSNTADMFHLDNTPDADSSAHLFVLKDRCDRVFPDGYDVVDAYRAPAVNAALMLSNPAAVDDSLHQFGCAVDLTPRGLSAEDAGDRARQSGYFREVIVKRVGLHLAINR